jgi:phage FluMu protein Com
MYQDNELWPFTCAHCGEHFQKQIGWLKAHAAIRCPRCLTCHEYRSEEFIVTVAQARKGLYDPLRYIHRAKTVAEFPEGVE